MIDKFLKAKHWQIFLLTFGIPMIFQFLLVGSFMGNALEGNGPSVEVIFFLFKIFSIVAVLFTMIFYGWFWSVGVGLQEKIPDDLKLNLSRFKVLLLVPIIYTTLMLLVIGFLSPYLFTMIGGPGVIFGVVFLFHFFAMFCIFHSLYFVAKTIKTAELQRAVTFGEFAGEFFLIWFFPIGVWVIQPTINKLMEEENEYL